MPDRDIVYRTIRVPRWRRPLRAARAGSSEAEVGDAIRSAAAEHFREKRGCQGVPQLAVAVRDAALDPMHPGWSEARERFVRQNGANQLSQRVLERAEFRLLTDGDGLRTAHSDHQLASDLMRSGLESLVHDQLWGRGQHLLLERFNTYSEVQHFIDASLNEASLDPLAQRALAHPDGRGLVAPPARRPRVSTAELLYESVEPQ
jgi:hypothetical protein